MTALYCTVSLFLHAFLTLSLNPFTLNAKIQSEILHVQLEINPRRGEILPKPSGQEMNTLHVAGGGPVPWRCGSGVKSAGGICLRALPSTSLWQGGEVHALCSGLEPRGSASNAAVSAGVGG